VLNGVYDFVLRLPDFKGKTRIASFCRSLLKPKVSRIIHGLAMELDSQEWLQIDLRAVGYLEPRTSALFERILQTGDTYVDVGAHVGYHCLLARHLVGEKGRIFAIDPQPYNCAKVLTNAELNGFANISVVTAAAGELDKFVSLKNQARTDKARLALSRPGVNDGMLTFTVPMISLAWLFKSYQLHQVDLLKIDVEGYELEVLRGAHEAILTVRNIVLEILPNEEPDEALAVARLLRESGFQLFDVDGADWEPGRECIENNVWARRS
jgi:FkbM family methyltransferase